MGREERLVQNCGSEQTPNFSAFELPCLQKCQRDLGLALGYNFWLMASPVLGKKRPGRAQQGEGSRLGGKLVPLTESQLVSLCVYYVLPSVPQQNLLNPRLVNLSAGKGLTAHAMLTCWYTGCKPGRNL